MIINWSLSANNLLGVSCFSFSSIHEFGSNLKQRVIQDSRGHECFSNNVHSLKRESLSGWFVLFQKRAVHYWISYFWGKLRNQHNFWITESPSLGSVWFSVSCGTVVLNATEVIDSVQVPEHKGQTLGSVAINQWILATVFSKTVSKLKEWSSQSHQVFLPLTPLHVSDTVITEERTCFSR